MCLRSNQTLVQRAIRHATRRRVAGGLDRPSFVGSDMSRSPAARCKYRVAFKKAGLNHQRAPGIPVHGFAHTCATETHSDVSVYTLMKLVGHAPMLTSQRYVDSASSKPGEDGRRRPARREAEPSKRGDVHAVLRKIEWGEQHTLRQ